MSAQAIRLKFRASREKGRVSRSAHQKRLGRRRLSADQKIRSIGLANWVPDEAALQRPKAAAALVSLAASAEEIRVRWPRTFRVVGAVKKDQHSSF